MQNAENSICSEEQIYSVGTHDNFNCPDKRITNFINGENKMKLIIAYIKPEKLNDVKQELYKHDIMKLSVTNALGCGQQGGYHETYRGVDIEVNLLKKIRLEIAVNDNFVDQTVDAITSAARTGMIGDGKVFVIELAQCIRIRTGESGNEAVG